MCMKVKVREVKAEHTKNSFLKILWKEANVRKKETWLIRDTEVLRSSKIFSKDLRN